MTQDAEESVERERENVEMLERRGMGESFRKKEVWAKGLNRNGPCPT